MALEEDFDALKRLHEFIIFDEKELDNTPAQKMLTNSFVLNQYQYFEEETQESNTCV